VDERAHTKKVLKKGETFRKVTGDAKLGRHKPEIATSGTIQEEGFRHKQGLDGRHEHDDEKSRQKGET